MSDIEPKIQVVTIGATINGPPQLLEFIIRDLGKLYIIHDIEYNSSENGVSWVRCKIKASMYVTLQNLIEIVAADLGINRDNLLNWHHYPRKIVFARDVIAFILRTKYELSYPAIADLLEAKHHASILMACRKFDPDLKNTIHKRPLKSAYLACKKGYKKSASSKWKVQND